MEKEIVIATDSAIESGEFIKLDRGKKGVCSWEIKVRAKPGVDIDKELIDRLEKIDDMCLKKWGGLFPDPEPGFHERFPVSHYKEYDQEHK